MKLWKWILKWHYQSKIKRLSKGVCKWRKRMQSMSNKYEVDNACNHISILMFDRNQVQIKLEKLK